MLIGAGRFIVDPRTGVEMEPVLPPIVTGGVAVCWEPVAAENTASAILELFKRFDVDDDGLWNKVEYKTYLRAIRSWGWEVSRSRIGPYTDETMGAIWPAECEAYRANAQLAAATTKVLGLPSASERIAAMQAELEIGLAQGWSVEGFDPAAEVVEDPVQWLWMRFSDGERVSRAQYTALSAMVGWSEVTDDEWVKDMRTSGGDPIHGLDRPAFEKIYEYEEDCAAAKDVEKVRGPKYWQTNEARKNVQSERPLTHQQNEVKNRVMLRINPALRATPYAYVCSLFAAFAVKLTRSAVHRLGQLHHADRRCKVSACRRI